MPDPTPNRPLWEVMQAAYFEGRKPGHCDRLGYAAELRAIASEIKQAAQLRTSYETAEWLLAEADRAEGPLPSP
jgi:hypothetical protein